MTVVALAILCAVQAACLVWFAVEAHRRLGALLDKIPTAPAVGALPPLPEVESPEPPADERVAVALGPDGQPELDLDGERPKNVSVATWNMLQEERMARLLLAKMDETLPRVGLDGAVDVDSERGDG